MKTKRNRFVRQAVDPVESCPVLAKRLARHLRWSAAIWGRFRRANPLPPWRTTTFVFGLRAKRMLSLVRRVLNFRLSWPRQEHILTVINNVAAQRSRSVYQSSSHACPEPHSQTLGPRAVPLAFWQSYTRQTLSYVERRSEHRVWRQGFLVARTLLPPPPASIMSLGYSNAITQEASLPEMTTRIARRMRRVEEAPRSAESRVVAGAATAHRFEEIVETPARKLYRDASPVYRSQPAASGPIPSGMNVTQLTDEVIRQIDRRLVAVRERMGKM